VIDEVLLNIVSEYTASTIELQQERLMDLCVVLGLSVVFAERLLRSARQWNSYRDCHHDDERYNRL